MNTLTLFYIRCCLLFVLFYAVTSHSVQLNTTSAKNPITTTTNTPLTLTINDTIQDAVFANYYHPNQLCWGQNQGFSGCVNISDEAFLSKDVALGDLNADGLLDAVFANDGRQNQLCLGKIGGFESCQPLSSHELQTIGVALADMNLDGHVDVIFANDKAVNPICLNEGQAHFQCKPLNADALSTAAVAVGDVNHDQYPDVLWAHYEHQNQVCLGNGQGGVNTCLNINEEILASYGVALGDLNQDGHLDSVFANLELNQVCLGDGQGDFSCRNIDSNKFYSLDVALGDINGDQQLDAVFANFNGQNNQRCLGNGQGDLNCVTFAEDGLHSWGVALGDIDQNGLLDAVFANFAPTGAAEPNRFCTAQNQCTAVSADELASVNVALGAIGVDSQQLILTQQPAHGDAVINAEGSITYMPSITSIPVSVLDLGTTVVGQTLTSASNMIIEGQLPLTLESMTLQGDAAADFKILALSFPLTLTQNQKMVTFQCQPSAVGERIALLNLNVRGVTQPLTYSLHCYGQSPAPKAVTEPQVAPAEQHKTNTGELIIKLKDINKQVNYSPAHFNALMTPLNIKKTTALFQETQVKPQNDEEIDTIASSHQLQFQAGQIYLLELPAQQMEYALELLEHSEAIDYVELNEKVKVIQTLPDDPYFNQQWYLYNIGQDGATPGADISAPEGWDIAQGSEEITLAIVDTGLDLTHEEFTDRVLPGYDFYNKDNDPSDDHSHGTQVAGIAAATPHNHKGITGVCWRCNIMPIKVVSYNDFSDPFTVAQGIIYAVDHGADVINLSLGFFRDSATINKAIDYADDLNIVVSAGNGGRSSLLYPAQYAQTLAVGAVDKHDNWWSRSNYGQQLDLVAPGVAILTSFPNNEYYLTQGTSVAAPQVTGAIGVLLSVCPRLTPEQIRTLLYESADDLGPGGWDQHYGAGRLNLEALLKAAQNSPGCPIACPQTPTIQSRRSGHWSDPSSWDLNRLPNRHDIVLVKASHQLTLPRQSVRVGSLCNYGQLMGTPRRRLTLMTTGKTAFIHNYGAIHAAAGADAKGRHCAQSGSDIFLKVKSGIVHNHSQAYIDAGDSGSNLQTTRRCNRNWGGRTTLLAQEIINEGHIRAGQGGDARTSLYKSWGGHGGRIYIRGNVGGQGQVTTTCGSLIQAGQGGNGYYGGRGGTLKLIARRKALCGELLAGQGGYGMQPGRNGRALIDPKSLFLNTQTHIWGGEVMLAGGAYSEFDFSALQTTAVTATETLTLNMGQHSQIKLPAATTSAIFESQQQVNIFSDADSAQLAPMITAPQGIHIQPAQAFSEVTLIAPGAITGFAGEQLTLDLQLANDSSLDDSFELQVSDTHGWLLNQLPTPIFIEAGGLRDESDGLHLQVKLPPTPGIQNALSVSATSEHNPQLTTTELIEIEVLELPTVQRSETTFVQSPAPQLPRCPSGGYINWQCRNEDQVITDAVLGPQANLAGGILAGNIDNQGFIAQIKIQAGTVVTGGTLSGYIVNEGVLADFEFVGAQIQGGILAGQIENRSQVGGVLRDVQLAAGSTIRGGHLAGVIQGDPQNPARLEHVVIEAESQVSGVISTD